MSATFSEPIAADTVSTTTFELRDASNNLVTGSVSYDALTFRATFTPSATLAYSSTYTATVKGGSSDPRIKDAAGNALAANMSWSFTTSAAPPPPPDTGPGGPILVVSSTSNPFSKYYAEILRTEGLNAFAVADINAVTEVTLANYDVVLLGDFTLTPSQVSMFTTWVNGGGNLIAMHPASNLASLLGLTVESGTLDNAYLLVNTTTAPGKGIVGQTIQYHSSANRFALNDATSVATLYSNATTPTTNPAVTVRNVGSNGGQAAAFTFDLARSVVYTRQGNPAWAGQERDGQAPIRSDDLFFGASASDPQPDWVDLNKVAIPQADEQQRLLANLISFIDADRKPLPRFWYFPSGKKAVVVMTGDDHANGGTAGRFEQFIAASAPHCSVDDWQCVRGTSYVYPDSPLTNAQAVAYQAQGFEVALHLTTNCGDFTLSSINGLLDDQLAQFNASYPSVTSPHTNRTHCIVWSDYTSEAQAEYAHGIRLDTTYYYWPAAWVNDRPGFFTGSGMPMRFATETGQFVDVYQAVSQMTDESDQSYPATPNTLFDKALGPEGYYGAFTANMHTDRDTIPQNDALMASALARGVPIVSARQMLSWLDGRNASSFSGLTWAGNTLAFTVNAHSAARNLQAMVPYYAGVGPIATIMRDGAPVTYTTEIIKGTAYAFVAAVSGSYQVTYAADTTPPAISAVAATTTTTTATMTWTTDEGATSRIDYGTSPASLTRSVSDSSLVNSHALTITGLAPGTQYYFRVTSADVYGNQGTSAPQVITTQIAPPPVAFTDTTVADFTAGTLSGLALWHSDDGELILQPAAGADFDGATLPNGWSGTSWEASGTVAVSAGALAVDGARVSTDNFFAAGSTLEFIATFSGQGSQHIGYGLTLSETPWAIFSTGSGGSIYARTNNGSTSTDTPIPGNWLATPHRFRITWLPGSVVYAIDGTVVATHAIAIGGTMRPIVSDLMPGGNTALSVDWLQLTPYASSGTFNSRVFDAGASTMWASAWWSASIPTGTTLNISARFGDTPVPDSSWTGFETLSASGAALSAASRYAQYSVVFSTTVDAATPVLNDVTLAGVGALDGPVISIADASQLEGAGGAQHMVFRVSLSKPSAQPITVSYVTGDGTATAGSDYQAGAGVLTFPAWTTQQFISIPVIGDTTVEPDETFVVTLSNASGATLLRSQAVGTIVNDDTASVGQPTFRDTTAADFAAGTVDSQGYVAQKADGEVTLAPTVGAEFTLAGLPPGWSTAPLVANGTAIVSSGRANVDGARLSTDALFAPGAALEFVATFGAESFQHIGFGLTLNETPWALFSTGGGTGVYARTNDGTQTIDTLIPGSFIGQPHRYRIDWTPSSVIYSIDGAVVATHPLAITMNMRPIASDAQVGIPLLIDWLHLAPYAPASTFLSRIFDAGTGVDWSSASYTAQTPTGTGVSISVRSGNVAVPDASWTTFTPVADASASIGLQGRYIQYQATLTTSSPSDTPALQDVTFMGTALPTLTVADVTVNEGNNGTTTGQFTVALSVPASSPVTVAYATANGSAVAGSDYTATNGTLTFPTGTATQVINVPIVGDTDVEGNETFSLILSSPTNATLGRPQATATIVDDDVPAASIADASITEGNTGTSNLVFTVTLSQPSTKVITVDYATADGTAVAGSDFTATAGALTFAAGTTTQTVVVPVLGDTTIEATETFTVTLSNPTNLTLGSAQATGTIVTDDLPTLSINDVSIAEGDNLTTNANFTVTLSAAFPQAVAVNFTTANGTATAGADYAEISGTLSFPAGTLTRAVAVPVLGDTINEGNETYTIVLSSPVNATLAKAIGTGTIVDNDPTPSLTINNVSVAEGNSGTTPAVFTVTLSAPSGRTVTVNCATANGTATAGSDYTAASGTLTFPAGSTTQTIAVPVLGDTTVEASETFVVRLSRATNASIVQSQGTGTIVNDDAKVTIGIDPTASTVTQPITVTGYAIDTASATGTGVDAIQVWAYPNPGSSQPAVFVAAATYGLTRSEIGTQFAARFAPSGYSFQLRGLAPAPYLLVVFARSTVSGTFTSQTRAITVRADPLMVIDQPSPSATVRQPFLVSGWAIDRAGIGTGVDSVDVQAIPIGGGSPVAIGRATYGVARSDVAAALGSAFLTSGYQLIVRGLTPGTWRLDVSSHSTVSGTVQSKSVTVQLLSSASMFVDTPTSGATMASGFTVSGWAIDASTPSGTGVDAIHVWAYPAAGGSPVFLGANAVWVSRPDVGAIFGSAFTPSGFNIRTGQLASGSWNLVVFARSTGHRHVQSIGAGSNPGTLKRCGQDGTTNLTLTVSYLYCASKIQGSSGRRRCDAGEVSSRRFARRRTRGLGRTLAPRTIFKPLDAPKRNPAGGL